MSCGGNGAPASLLRHEENIIHSISVTVILETVAFLYKLLISLVKCCGNITQKNKPYDYLSVFCSRYMSPQDAGSIPQLFFKAYIGICFISHKIILLNYRPNCA